MMYLPWWFLLLLDPVAWAVAGVLLIGIICMVAYALWHQRPEHPSTDAEAESGSSTGPDSGF